MSGIPAGAGSLLGKRLGKFEILALLALGGTAEIYLARIAGAAGFEKYVVVKCLHDHLADDPEFVKMFLDEARLAAHLDHSNIVQTTELGEYENRYYMVMEYLAGLSLAMVVRRANERLSGGLIPVPLVLNMMAQACAGLHYAHEKVMNGKPLNIVHRDISPQNLVVSFEGVVKVVDFGIAKADMRETKTRSGTIKGKFAYMSPEQCVATNVDRRTDVFALGIITYELLTGRRLFKRTSPYETYQAVIECAVDPPSKMNIELDPALDEIIMRAVARAKEDRYPTAEAFGDALQRYLHSRGKGSSPAEISRFFDASFGQEIEEYGARMRELIQGRESFSVDTGVTWGGDDEEAKRIETLDIARGHQADERSLSLDTADLVEDEPRDERGDDDLPAERTRIEANPLDRMAENDEPVAKDPVAKPEMPTVPLQPHPSSTVPWSGSLPLTAPPTGPILTPSPKISVGKFPEYANLPTMIVEPDPEPPPSAQHPTQPAIPLGPTGYPVMSPQMSAQMMSGNLYPSEKPVRPSQSQGPTLLQNPQHAASLVSPVGQQYPQHVDWDEAAAMPARALPPWMLAALFVTAIVIASTITIIIAKIAS